MAFEAVTVVTGWSPEGYALYGRRFVQSFARFWPRDVRLLVYVEETERLPRGEQRIVSDVPTVKAFLERHRRNPKVNGRAPTEGWTEKDRRRGYSFRFDAWKFGRVPLYIRDAAREIERGVLIWLDGDVVTFKEVTPALFRTVLPKGADVSYLGRKGYHSEIGFQGYRLPGARPFIETFAEWYATGAFLHLDEWHSAHVFDATRQACEVTGLRCHNLTPNGSGHVWFQSPLGAVMDHLKGDNRKARGWSLERRR